MDLFNNLSDLAKYGLIGVAIASIGVLGYIAIKRPENKYGLKVVSFVCVFIIALFTFAGIGVVKENKVVKEKNETLDTENKQLSQETEKLSEKIKVKDAKLDIVSFQNQVLSNQQLSKDSLSRIADHLSKNFEFLAQKDSGVSKTEWTSLANDYKNISSRLRSSQFNERQANMEFRITGERTAFVDKIIRE
jgi:uncharacterized membrane protein (Fun14 family)